jgi:hypothetical protein
MSGLRLRDLRRGSTITAAFLLAGGTALGAAVCVIALSDPDGPVAGAAGLAPSQEVKSQRLLTPARLTPVGLALGEAAARAALRQGPTRATAWLDLAYAETRKAGALSTAARDALRRSYVFEPLGPDNTGWRVRFAFEHWDELTPDLRDSALAEVRAQWPSGEHNVVAGALAGIQNPAGRLAATVLTAQLNRPPPKS